MDTDIPLFFSEIQYLLLETIPLENIMRDTCVVAPKLCFQNTIFGAVLEFVLKFAILVDEHKAPKWLFPRPLST